MFLLRHRVFAVVLLLLGISVCLRLPPGQYLLGRLAQRQIADVMGGSLSMEQLRTNLWDDIRLRGVSWQTDDGPVAQIDLDEFHLRWSGGPAWSGPPTSVDIRGLRIQLRTVAQDSTESAPSSIDEAPAADDASLQSWIPGRLHLQDVQVSLAGDSTGIGDTLAGLRGSLHLVRAAREDEPPGLT